MIRALFFDAGGTLLRTAEPVGQSYARIAAKLGWKASEEKLERGFRLAWNKRREEGAGESGTLGQAGWEKMVWASCENAGMPPAFPFRAYFGEVYAYFAKAEAWHDYPETAEVMREVSRRGVRVGLLSNWDARLRQILAGFAWGKQLDPILISEECGAEKPEVSFFRRAEEVVGARAQECALVGDDPRSDGAGAKKAGWQVALVARPQRGLWEALEELGL